ncbi:MAG: hypothetical protein KDD41_11935 [Flavobacteriales bacterium]|nr:hypothetical protein [Flavobacteriales bacterium]
MKTFLLFCLLAILISCSKQESCWCNAGDGEYRYLPSYSSTTGFGHSGDLEEECNLEERMLTENVGSAAYCELR